MSDQKIIFSMVGVNKSFSAGKQVIRDISLSYFYGAKIGVLGLNGSGKSTLLKIMAGVDKEFNGEIHKSDDITFGYLEQEPHLEAGKTVRQIVEEAVPEVVGLLKKFDEINAKFAEEMTPEQMEDLLAEQAKVQDKLDKLDAWSLDDKLNFAMESLRCPAGDQIVDTLSGGERRRVALCRLLLQEPDVLLLDEPTNHLDAESVQWLERHLHDYKGTVIAVTHDRYFLDNVAGWILELDRGHGIPWKGNYSSWLEQKQKRLANEAKAEDKRKKTLERELEWIRMSPKARQSKNKARVSSYEKLLNSDQEKMGKDLQIFIPNGPRLGSNVVDFEKVSMAFDDNLLYEDLSFKIPAGGIVGIVGANGAGKTTLFNLMTGGLEPISGKVTVGESVKLGYMEQSRDVLNSEKRVWEVIANGSEVFNMGNREMNTRTYLGGFNITGGDQQKFVKQLSGGERNRVQLAMLIKEQANVILMDEPTNDLDVNTLRALEDALLDFAGCAICISHDRWFLDRIATHILAFEGDSKAVWYEGSYSDYEEDRKKRLGEAAKTPHRIRYAKIKR